MSELRLEPMTEDRYSVFRERSNREHARDIAGSGRMSCPDAVRQAAQDYDRLMPGDG